MNSLWNESKLKIESLKEKREKCSSNFDTKLNEIIAEDAEFVFEYIKRRWFNLRWNMITTQAMDKYYV